ncbi:sugar-binding transcriptional regulator [Bacillus altitudinis MN12]|uniref:Sugar-binding transcriptional regulator n=3 Tax=Bacillus TaxID=1386 RepID=A0ABV1S6Q3_BACAB|nr:MULTISPECIES: sugar-binding transcriptional regulator [Bacillus]ANT56510.1 transcriptional regulator [Bacillus pumilus]EMI13489.1 transcriptional regulator [Bacillus stratosphericus LAMA 585]MCA0924468.1 sugar-binding transcriptional regulator [Bacillus stratosphericus]QAR54045.1 transcriptional regulator [Bacillus aerophilus]AKU32207.1 transcriptional regulator [Bacillus altitudinis]
MTFHDERRLLIKVAHMYYEEGATQSKIAEAVGVSRSLISKYLAKAREAGIVEIIIHDEVNQQYGSLERKIERKYGLREVVCVESLSQETTKSRIGAAAAGFLLKVMKDGQVIGFSSGTTLHEMAKALTSVQHFPSVTFVPLVGGVGNEDVDIHANYIIGRCSEALKSKCEFLHVPVMLDTKEAKDVLIRQPSIKKVIELGESSNIAVVGIGGVPQHSTMVKSYMTSGEEDILQAKDVAGDICYNFIDHKGEVYPHPWNDRVMGISPQKLKEIPLVIGVAGGEEKIEAIRAALEGGLIHVLITDEQTGDALLK